MSTINVTQIKTWLPNELHARLSLTLLDPLTGRIPHGALARYISRLIREDLDRRAKQFKPTLEPPPAEMEKT